MEVVISGSGLFTPESIITNEELVNAYNAYAAEFNQINQAAIAAGDMEAKEASSVEFIEKASGIKQRHVLYKDGILDTQRMRPIFSKRPYDQAPEVVDMGLVAAKQALERANVLASDIDLVIVAASNNQRAYPAVAIELQRDLGAKGYAYDMNVACSSATFAIVNAMNAIKSGTASKVLVVNPEFASPQVDYTNRDSHFIFGDVCTALVIEKAQEANSNHQFQILGCDLKTEYSLNIRCNLNYTDHCVGELPQDNSFFLQEGRKVFKELLPMVTEVISTHLERKNIDVSEIKRMWLHQANINMNHFAVKKLLGREPEENEAPLVLDRYANTASAGSIIAFHLYQDDLVKGDKAVLCSFGAGYSVGCLSLQKC